MSYTRVLPAVHSTALARIVTLASALLVACSESPSTPDESSCLDCPLVRTALPSMCLIPNVRVSDFSWAFAFGDWGTGGAGQRAVAQQVSKAADLFHPRAVLLLGDNFYESGVTGTDDPRWNTWFESMYTGPSLEIPFYAVLGNHDYLTPGSAAAQVAYTKLSARWRLPRNYYTFIDTLSTAVGLTMTVRYVALETDAIVRGLGVPKQLAWLDSVLTADHSDWVIAFGHQPLFGTGEYGDTPVLHETVRPIIERHGVQLYVGGHAHNVQILRSVTGPTYVISGAGAGADRKQEYEQTGLLEFGTNVGSFLALGIARDSMVIKVIDQRGCLLHSRSVLRSTPSAGPPAKP